MYRRVREEIELLVKMSFILLLALPAYSAHWEASVDSNQAQVEFLSKIEPGGLNLRGKMQQGTIDSLKGSFVVTKFNMTGSADFILNTLETGIKLRDKHMRQDYLQTDTYPVAHFELTRLLVPRSFLDSGYEANETFEGKLTLRGITKAVKPVVVEDSDKSRIARVHLKGAPGKMHAAFKFEVALTDFKIKKPTFMGVSLADKVLVEVELELDFKKVN